MTEILDSPPNLRSRLQTLIEKQHSNRELGSLFSAIFLATPLEKNTRERMTLFGVNHLVALSGFHLGIISSVIFFILLPLYRVLQSKFFPWRDRNFDLGLLILGMLGAFLLFVDSPPSLVRSYAMMLFGWVALMFWMKLVSFEFLGIVVATILALSPAMAVSLSFWLSVAGVFYIFLILHHIRDKFLLAVTLPFLIHILMIPIAHAIFDEVSPFQWLSPILSWLFIPFYPISFLAHLLGFGGVMDSFLLYLWRVPLEFEHKILPIYLLVFYLIFSLLAMKYRQFFYILIGCAVLDSAYLYLF